MGPHDAGRDPDGSGHHPGPPGRMPTVSYFVEKRLIIMFPRIFSVNWTAAYC